MSKKSILLAEDSKAMRELVVAVLEDAGYSVTSFEDGLGAVTFARNHTVDLVITDINMPKMNGDQVVQNLRRKVNYAKVPILILTSIDSEEEKADFKKYGANGWIKKPIDPQRLLAAVEATLAR